MLKRDQPSVAFLSFFLSLQKKNPQPFHPCLGCHFIACKSAPKNELAEGGLT